jgi:beta-lactamase class A
MLATGRAVNQMASQDMVDLMTRQRVRNRLPALLPPGTQVAHKTGNWPSATHDVGIVYAPSAPYVIAVMSDKAWEVQQIAELSRLVYDHFEEEKPATDEEP